MDSVDVELRLLDDYYETAASFVGNGGDSLRNIKLFEGQLKVCERNGLLSATPLSHYRAELHYLWAMHKMRYEAGFVNDMLGAGGTAGSSLLLSGLNSVVAKSTCKEAIAELNKAITIRSDWPEYWLRRARFYGFIKDYGRAIADLDHVISIYAPESTAYFEARKLRDVFQASLSESSKKSGCFIATAAYGSPDAPEVAFLREFRDRILTTTPIGRTFIDFYYRTSPPIARLLSRTTTGRVFVRALLLAPLGHMARKALNRLEFEA